MGIGMDSFHEFKQTKARYHKTHSLTHSFLTSAGAFVSSTFLSSPSSFSSSSTPPSTSSLVPSRIYTCFDRISASWLSNSNSSIPERLPTKLPLPITSPPLPPPNQLPPRFPNPVHRLQDRFIAIGIAEQHAKPNLAIAHIDRPDDFPPFLRLIWRQIQTTLIESGRMCFPPGETENSISESSFPATNGAEEGRRR